MTVSRPGYRISYALTYYPCTHTCVYSFLPWTTFDSTRYEALMTSYTVRLDPCYTCTLV